MRSIAKRRGVLVLPVAVSVALTLSACGGSDDTPQAVAEQPAAPSVAAPEAEQAAEPAAAPAAEADTSTTTKAATAAEVPAAKAPAVAAPAAPAAKKAPAEKSAKVAPAAKKKAAADKTTKKATKSEAAKAGVTSIDSAAQKAKNEQIAQSKNGATDVGVTKDAIRMGSVSMHGMALGNVLVAPIVRGIQASMASINDRGGVLGRRLSLVDCDDGPGEVSRSKSCIKKLAKQDKVFALMGYSSWASASVHDDLRQHKLPAVGTWAYSQTEWQDPYMFPTHMSMIHEAMAGAQWVKNVIKPKTYALICLTSPEMQLACNEVSKILEPTGAKMVKKADVSISETSMSSHVLSLRAANPEHIIHYVINPATMAKFMVEAAQQNYYPSKGISGNHLAAEVLGSLFGKHPVNRYWTNTTYKLWGPEFMATMNKYARANRGTNHHIVQALYVGAEVLARAGKAVGPNLTRERLMAQLGNGDVYEADASLDQRFSWVPSERQGTNWDKNMGQGREFMYKYTSTNTAANPDGSPSGFAADPDQHVIYTWK